MAVLFKYQETENILESAIINNLEEINITPEQINELCNYFKSLDIPITEATKKSKDNRKLIKKDLNKQFGEKKANAINKNIDKASMKIAETIKKVGLNNDAIKAINDTINETTEICYNICKLEKNIQDNAIKLVLFTLIINSILNVVLSLFLGPIGQIVTTVIVGPLVEEMSKRLAIKSNCEKEFTALFNSCEFTSYVLQFGPSIGFVKIALVRLIPVVMHLSTALVQSISNNPKLLKAMGVDKEKDKELISTTGYMLGVLIHGAYNASCYLF